MQLTRRTLAAGVSAIGLWVALRQTEAAGPLVTVTKDPNCGCCTGWVEHLRAEGFIVDLNAGGRLQEVKRRLGVPADIESCHTAETSGYVLEGHVPVAAIRRLLVERPRAKGLAVPGMPVGSPGMELEGTPSEDYEVVLFGAGSRKTFGRFNGVRELNR